MESKECTSECALRKLYFGSDPMDPIHLPIPCQIPQGFAMCLQHFVNVALAAPWDQDG